MVVSSELRTHKVMEAAIRALMGAGTPPFFKFKDTYASIEFPAGYTIPLQETLENKYNELLALENDIQATTVEGDLEVGTSNLFVDTETGSVGIGTTNPQVELDVSGIVNISSNLEVGTSNLFVDTETGNVGIGTTNPGQTLSVHGTATSPISKRAHSSATTTYNYILNGPRPGTTSGGAVHFINGSGRSGDGGVSTYTIRNDSGPTVFGNASYVNRLRNPKDEDYIVGTWKTTLDASAATTVGMNVGSCMSTPAATGSGMTGNIGRFTAPVTGYYYTFCSANKATRNTSNLLIVYDASGTNFATNNFIGTYNEIIDLRSPDNVEETYTFVATLYMEANDWIQYRVHSSGYTDNASHFMFCSVFLLNRV